MVGVDADIYSLVQSLLSHKSFLCFTQEYVFDAEDGHTEMMPVRLKMRSINRNHTQAF